ncbi:MAG: hypothetical protein KDA62_18110 [Planctomycetales bacterium]|nr:hypothetical protein [Planctomycetales bacterium]
MAKHTRHQEKIIKRYYDNREAIAVQRVQELITELYLSEGKKRQQHWKNMALHLEKLGVKPAQIEHLVQQDNPELIAKLLQELS